MECFWSPLQQVGRRHSAEDEVTNKKCFLVFCLFAFAISASSHAATDAYQAYVEHMGLATNHFHDSVAGSINLLSESTSLQATGFNGGFINVLAPGRTNIAGGYGVASWMPSKASVDALAAESPGNYSNYRVPVGDLRMGGPFVFAGIGLPGFAGADAVDVGANFRFASEPNISITGFGIRPRVELGHWRSFRFQMDLIYQWAKFEETQQLHRNWSSGDDYSLVPGYSVSDSLKNGTRTVYGELGEGGFGADVLFDSGLEGLLLKAGIYGAAVFGTMGMDAQMSSNLIVSGPGTPSSYAGPMNLSAKTSNWLSKFDSRIRCAAQFGTTVHFFGTLEYSFATLTYAGSGGVGVIW